MATRESKKKTWETNWRPYLRQLITPIQSMLHTNQVTKSIACALNGNYSFLHFFVYSFPLQLDRAIEHRSAWLFLNVWSTHHHHHDHQQQQQLQRLENGVDESTLASLHRQVQRANPKKQKKIAGKDSQNIHTKGRKRDAHGVNNSALWSYCKFSVGRFLFTFVTLSSSSCKKIKFSFGFLHINGTGNLVVG